jgi:universal stress protein A
MSGYKHVLLAADLTEESEPVADRAVTVAKNFDAKLHVIHVIEPLSLAYGGDIPMDQSSVQDQIHEQAKSHLAEFCASINVPIERQHLIFGRTEAEIHRLSLSEEIDVIIVGSHGRHGLALLLGSTANGVLHGASCDVLAVRVGVEAPKHKND